MIFPSADIIEEKIGSRYTLVILAAKRAKQIKEGAPLLIDTDSTNPLTIALEEIAAGKVTVTEAPIVVAAAPAPPKPSRRSLAAAALGAHVPGVSPPHAEDEMDDEAEAGMDDEAADSEETPDADSDTHDTEMHDNAAQEDSDANA